MVFDPNPTWTAAIGESPQKPQYFVRFDGITDVQYSTHPIKAATRTTKGLLEVPESSRAVIDLQAGSATTATVRFTLLDVLGEIANIIAWDRTGAPIVTLISHRVQVFGGYAHMDEADYPAIFTGRINGVAMTNDLLGFAFDILDFTSQFDQQIMLNAEPDKISRITGNVVNCVWAILTGTFSTSDPNFPLEHVSVSSELLGTSVPTGLNIPAAEIDSAVLIAQRDRWFPSLDVIIEFDSPDEGRTVFETEFMRVFAMFLTVSGEGKIGFKHRIPVLPVSSATVIDDKLMRGIKGWRRRLDLHANRFRFIGDFDISDNSTKILYEEDSASDIADRAATGDTITMELTSSWVKSDLNGAIIAALLSSRARFLFQSTPATFTTSLVFTQRNLEIGDSIALTHPALPDLSTGERGVVQQIFMIIGMQPNFQEGVIEVDLLDTRYLRYGIIGPDALPDYDAATTLQKNTYTWIGDATLNQVGSPLVDGYRII